MYIPIDSDNFRFNELILQPTIYFGDESNDTIKGEIINPFYTGSFDSSSGFYGTIRTLIEEFYYQKLGINYNDSFDMDDSLFVISLPMDSLPGILQKNELEIHTNQTTDKSFYIKDNYIIYDNDDSDNYVGYYLLSHGLIVFTNYQDIKTIVENITIGNTYIKLKLNQKIRSYNITANIPAGDFNATMNLTAVNDDNEYIYKNVTYVTTIGLYNDNSELIAIARLAKPLFNDYEQKLNLSLNLDV